MENSNNNLVLKLVDVVLVLLQPVVTMISLLLQFSNWGFVVIHTVVKWRDLLHTVWDQIQPLVHHFEIVDALSDVLLLACWLLDLAIVPQWIRDTFIQCFNRPRRVGRPRRFSQLVPIIRVMVEKFDYTNARVRRVLRTIGVGLFPYFIPSVTFIFSCHLSLIF